MPRSKSLRRHFQRPVAEMAAEGVVQVAEREVVVSERHMMRRPMYRRYLHRPRRHKDHEPGHQARSDTRQAAEVEGSEVAVEEESVVRAVGVADLE